MALETSSEPSVVRLSVVQSSPFMRTAQQLLNSPFSDSEWEEPLDTMSQATPTIGLLEFVNTCAGNTVKDPEVHTVMQTFFDNN